MKKSLLLVTLLSCSFANAQMTSANEPALGESVNLFVIDSFATNYANVVGSGVTWDYNNTAGYNGNTNTVEVLDASTQTYASSFAGATKVISVGGNINTFFSSTASDRTSQGFHMNEASLGDVLVMYDVNPLIMATYPMSYGSGDVVDNYEGNLSLTFNGGPVNEALTGNSIASVDGDGTLIFPDGTTTSNVLRYHSVDTAVTNLPLFGPADVIRDQYEYYDYASQNLPVFMHVRITIIQSGGSIPVAQTNLVLSKYQALGNVSVDELDEIKFTVTPNPVSDIITISGEFSSDAKAIIADQSGRILSSFTAHNGQTLNMADYASGMYLITINDGSTSTTKTIVKK